VVARALSVGALVVAVVVVAVLVLRNGNDYVIHARFVDAGQLVKGNLVEVGGRRIGSITDIRLTNDNQADVVMKITDDEFKPLHEGTIATVRQVGLSGVANRFVELTPGFRGRRALRDGATLRTADTRPIVDLDEVLNALDAPTRRRLQTLVRRSSQVLAGNSQEVNQATRYLNPALSQTAGLAEEIVRDQVAFERLITSTSTIASALAQREGDLEGAVSNTARSLRAVAGERAALEDTLARAPRVLDRARPTLRRLRRTLEVVRPLLRDARPAARPLARVLRLLPPSSRNAIPLVAELRRLLPALNTTIRSLAGLAREIVPVVNDTTESARGFLPILAGLRPYTPDLVAGLYNGFGGSTGGYYDANGHYARIAAHVPASAGSGLASLLGVPNVPDLNNVRTGLTARCPGGAVESAPDGSNPWIPDPSICDHAHDHP
jgi:phospholipid/cholesterol/gamma-HCH transport system substrate-binding protein